MSTPRNPKLAQLKSDALQKAQEIGSNLKIACNDIFASPDDPLKTIDMKEVPKEGLMMLNELSQLYLRIEKIHEDIKSGQIAEQNELDILMKKLVGLDSLLQPGFKHLMRKDLTKAASIITNLDKIDLSEKKLPAQTQLKKKKAFRYKVGTEVTNEDPKKKKEIAIAFVKDAFSNKNIIAKFKNPKDADKFKHEIIDRINNPSCMNQEDNSLCGPTTFLMQLAELDPKKYAETAIKLLTDKKVTISNPESDVILHLENTYDEKKQAERSIDMVFLSALRRDANRTNIYASSKAVPELIEMALGYTSPEDFTRWNQAFLGNCDIKNMTQVYASGQKPLSEFLQKLTGVKNDPQYADLDKNLDTAIQDVKKGHSACMFLTMGLTNLIIAYSKEPQNIFLYNIKDDVYAPLVGAEFAHYVKIKKLDKVIDSNGNKFVDVVMSTWTKEHTARVPYEEFMKGYRGCILVNPRPGLELREKHDTNRTSQAGLFEPKQHAWKRSVTPEGPQPSSEQSNPPEKKGR